MPISQDTYNKNLYDLLSVRYDVTPINSKGQTTPVPQEADVFRFEFTKDGEKYGDVWITIDGGKNLIVYYDDKIADSGEENTSGTTTPDTWTHLIKQLKHWARHNLLSFELKNRNHLSKDMAQREHMKKKEQIGEGYYPMGKKASYSDNIPTVKILLQHTRQIEEGEQRFRNVEKIFVENVNGERFLLPTNRPGIARVYARHIAEGGTPYDDKGKHITSLVEEYTKMAGFIRATRNGQFNEDAQKLVNVGFNHYQSLKETLTKMTTIRGYNKYFESYTPILNEENTEDSSLNELFVNETLDPRIESVMPILSKLKKQISEMEEVKELDEWAETVISEKLLDDPKKKDKIVSEEKKEIYLVVDRKNPAQAEGFWDGVEFIPFDKTKYTAGRLSMVPSHLMVYKGDGPLGTKELDYIRATRESKEGPADEPEYEDMDADDDRWNDAEPGEEEVDEGRNVKYFYVKVNGEEKFKTRNELEAHRIAKEMKADTAFDGKTIDVVEKNDYEVQINENENRESGRALKSLRNLAIMKPELTYVKLEASGLKQIVDNAIKACKDMKRYYLNKNQTPYAQFFYNLENEIENFKKGYNSATYNPDEDKMIPIDLSDLSRGTLGKIKFEEGVAEDLDANQKRAGQLGPTEPVGKNEKNLRGKLVGASESVELDTLKLLSGIK